MNVLTSDLISMIVTRKFQIIHRNWNLITYKDQDGNYHRINSPAQLWSTSWVWYYHNKWHRDNLKPAVKLGNHYEWYNMGKFVTKRKK